MPAEFRGNKRFEVLRELGRGATGVVYAAQDHDGGTEVALKVLRDLAPEAVASFKQEFRTLSDFDHPNLVKLGELIHAEGRWLFTMELVSGLDFLAFVRPRGVVDAARLRHALEQLVMALSALHGAGKIHRDVKPSNVLVREDGSLKLLDFGLVVHSDPGAHAQSIDQAVGTTAYVAPEQAAARAVTPAADLYALGVMLYEALTGVVPFAGPPLKVLMEKQTERPRAPRELVADVDADLEELCLALLAPDPLQRPSESQLLSRLRGRRSKGVGLAPLTRSHAFFGRDGELGRVLSLVESCAPGLSFVVVHGPPGIGKTTLWLRATRRLAGEGALVFAGRCREQESVPYRAVDGVIEELAQAGQRARPHLPQPVAGRRHRSRPARPGADPKPRRAAAARVRGAAGAARQARRRARGRARHR